VLLKVINLEKSYPAPDTRSALTILDNITFTADTGLSMAIIGPSGSGKSTLLNIIGALDKPTAGQVLLNNRDLSGLTGNQLAEVRNREIGFIFQQHHLLPQCTLLENVLVPVLAQKRPDLNAARDRALQLIAQVGLGERLHHRPGQLSGGECQRIAVVRALINRPKLLLADEPTGSLDHQSSLNLVQLLNELQQIEQLALIMVTHSRELAEKMACIYHLQDGQLHREK